MSTVSSSALVIGAENSFEEAGLKRTTVLTGNHHAKINKPQMSVVENIVRGRTMSEND